MLVLGWAVGQGSTPVDRWFAHQARAVVGDYPGWLLVFTDWWLLGPVLAACVGAALYRRQRRMAVVAALCPIVAIELDEAFKRLVDRHKGDALAYPSGHTAAVVVVMGMVVLVAGARLWALAAAVAISLLGMLGQIACGHHYFTDTVGAVLLTSALLCAAARLADRFPPGRVRPQRSRLSRHRQRVRRRECQHSHMASRGSGAMRCPPAVLVAMAALTAACAPGPVVNTGDTSARTEPTASTPAPPTPADNLHLANAYDFFASSGDQSGYYFTTPSGRWRCAILPHTQAGCQSASGSAMSVPGAPDSVTTAAGKSSAPNAMVIDNTGDAHFAWLQPSEFSPVPGPAKVLEFNRVLDAAGFRCNVQDAGVSCLSELTVKGFTFSPDGYTLQYNDVPDNAPP